jgi:hypothetical protein
MVAHRQRIQAAGLESARYLTIIQARSSVRRRGCKITGLNGYIEWTRSSPGSTRALFANQFDFSAQGVALVGASLQPMN